MKKITKNNLKELCRTCMKTLNLPISSGRGRKRRCSETNQYLSLNAVPQNNTTDEAITNTILELLLLVQPQIVPEMLDELPENMCKDCVDNLLITHSFLKTYQDSEIKLREFLDKSINIKSELLNVDEPNADLFDEQILEQPDENEESEICDILKEEEIEGFTGMESSKPLSEYLDDSNDNDSENYDEIETNEFLEDVEDILEEQDSKNETNVDNDKNSTAKRKKSEKKTTLINEPEKPATINEDGTIPCTHCDVSISGLTKWRNHMRQHRKELRMQAKYKNPPTINDQGKYICDECDEKFETLKSWKIHIKEHGLSLRSKLSYPHKKSDGVKKSYTCEYCEKVFDRWQIYKYHLKGHTVVTKNSLNTDTFINPVVKNEAEASNQDFELFHILYEKDSKHIALSSSEVERISDNSIQDLNIDCNNSVTTSYSKIEIAEENEDSQHIPLSSAEVEKIFNNSIQDINFDCNNSISTSYAKIAEENKVLIYGNEKELLTETSTSFKIQRQNKRNSGQSYVTVTGKFVNERTCKPFDDCRKNCKSKISYDACKQLFDQYWSLGSYEKRLLYIGTFLEIRGKKCDTLINSIRKRQRLKSIKYTLHTNGKSINVCRKHFCCCFDETESFVRSIISKKIEYPSMPFKDRRGKSKPYNKLRSEKIDEVKNHINKFAASSTRDPTQKYLNTKLSKSKMHKLYCAESEDPVSLSKYSEIFRSMNIKLKSRKI